MDLSTAQAKSKASPILPTPALFPAALLYKSRAIESLWRAHVTTTNALCEKTEERINVLQETHYKGMISLNKRLESLEGKIEEARNNGDTDAIEKVGEDVIKARTAIEKAEHKRVELLQRDYTDLQVVEKKLRGEKAKLEVKLVEARTNGYVADANTFIPLRSEVEEMQRKCDGQKEEMRELEEKYVELEGRYGVLEGEYKELEGKYGKKCAEYDTALGQARKARAEKKARDAAEAAKAAAVNGGSLVVQQSTVVQQGKKRAAEEEGVDVGGKRARVAGEVLEGGQGACGQEVEATPKTTSGVPYWL
jgi:chromosome segregation ATPase